MRYYENEMVLDEARLCLDFTNTLDWHNSPNPIESLVDYPALVKWAVEKQILMPAEEEELLYSAENNPAAAETVLQEAIQLREAIYQILVNAHHGQKSNPPDLAIVNSWSARLLPRRELTPDGMELNWQWQPVNGRLDQLLGPVVVSALDLITTSDLQRVRQCADDRGCGWLFLDTSRNHSRQWCSMESCGNRAKARRHYQRARQAA